MKKDIRDYYRVKLAGTAWDVGYYAATPIHAVRQLLRDKTYNLGYGVFKVEVELPNKEKKLYTAEKKKITKDVIIIN